MSVTTFGELLLSINGSLLASIVMKATVTTALTLILVRIARRARAAVRHVMLASALAILLVLPILAIVAPVIPVAVPDAVYAALAETGGFLEDLTTTSATPDSIRRPSPGDVGLPLSSSTMLTVVWVAGAILFMLPIPIALGRMRALRNASAPWSEGQALVDAMATEIGVASRVTVLLNESLPGPMTCGVRRPAILLPADAVTWTTDDLCRAIVHELEHVRRRDWLLLGFARTVCAAYWFHPLVWATRRQLALEAERACDDAVLRRAVAVDYADQLVALARRISAAPAPPALAMAGRADLAARVGAVLDVHQRRGRAGATWIVTACAASAFVATAMSPLKIVAAETLTPEQPAAATAHQQPADTGQKFAVASIRPCTTGEVIRPSGGGGRSGGYGGGRFDTSPDTLNIQCMTLGEMTYLAYVAAGKPLLNTVRRSTDLPVKGGQDWMHSERWTIEAKASGPAERMTMLRMMLPALLEERFELKHHRATEERPMYAMVVAKGGLKISPMKPGECSEVDLTASRVMPDEDKYWCHALTQVGNPGNRMIKMGSTTLANFASAISDGAGRFVIDQTGNTDVFNITIRFAPADAPPSDQGVESIFTALEKQLGLKLEPTKGQGEYLVLDSAVRPKLN